MRPLVVCAGLALVFASPTAWAQSDQQIKAWQRLSEAEKQALRGRHRELLNMSSKQRAELKRRLRLWRSLPRGEQQRIRKAFKSYQGLSAVQRRRVDRLADDFMRRSTKRRAQLRRLMKHVLSNPKLRKRFLNNLKHWRRLTPRQKLELRRRLKRRLGKAKRP